MANYLQSYQSEHVSSMIVQSSWLLHKLNFISVVLGHKDKGIKLDP